MAAIRGKRNFFYLALCLVLSLLVFSSPACTTRKVPVSDETGTAIDSLIRTRRINEKTILISFGYDAVTAIETKKGIVVIDAGISSNLTKRYRKIIADEFRRNDFVYVINTHGHTDHSGGNNVFPEAGIIGQVNITGEIQDYNKGREKVIENLKRTYEEYDSTLKKPFRGSAEWNDSFTQMIRYKTAYEDALAGLIIRQPEITFSDSLVMTTGDAAFEMIWFGEAHSNSDILVFVPELKILFTGDLLSSYGRPGFRVDVDMAPEKRDRAIRWIKQRKDNSEIIVNGHGQILSVSDLDSFLDKISSLHGLPLTVN